MQWCKNRPWSLKKPGVNTCPTDQLTVWRTDWLTNKLWVSAVHPTKNAKAYSLRYKSKLICSYNLHLSMKQTFSCLNTTLQNRRSSIYTPLSEWPQNKKQNVFLLSNAVKAIWWIMSFFQCFEEIFSIKKLNKNGEKK